MLTVDGLRAFGADVDGALARCMNMEAFYLKLVEKSLADAGYDTMKNALEASDLAAAFEAAHGLKGVLGNLGLTPIYDPVSEITELLRAKTETDYTPYLQTILEKRDALKALCE